MTPEPRTLWLAGASGLVGRALLDCLRHNTQAPQDPLSAEAAPAVQLLLRRPCPALHADGWAQAHLVDFSRADLGGPSLPAPHGVFISLGSTMAQAGSEQAFRAVDHEAVLHVARAARAAGARRCGVVSALGADARSRVFYNRVKGEMEADLMALGFERLVIARPSLLSGPRAALGQADRPGERWALRLSLAVRPLIPLRWRPIEARVVAQALCLALAQDGPALQVLESAQLHVLGAAA